MGKKDWRIHKRIKKDKAKRQYIWGGCYNDGPQPWFKRLNNKRVRQKQKRLILEGEESYTMQNFIKYLKEWWT